MYVNESPLLMSRFRRRGGSSMIYPLMSWTNGRQWLFSQKDMHPHKRYIEFLSFQLSAKRFQKAHGSLAITPAHWLHSWNDMNVILRNKLKMSKWTAATPANGEKHFLVLDVLQERRDSGTTCVLEAINTHRRFTVTSNDLKDCSRWQRGWR